MFGFRKNYLFRRLVVLAVALLISNIAALSCAMAYALCADCPEHPPTLCSDPCATSDVTINDKTDDIKSDVHRPVAHPVAVSSRDTVLRPKHSPVIERDHKYGYPTPPLHLQFCVFLK
jgi:hypothetical protein